MPLQLPAIDSIKPYFLDNIDPDGFDRVLAGIGCSLSKTLTIVISKSGGTAETRNGMLEVMQAYRKSGLSFEKHAVFVTGVGSSLDKLATSGKWMASFPMWDWVGGRTSITSAVGVLPMALQGIDITDFIGESALCDNITQNKSTKANSAAVQKDMVVLPYKDRLQLFSKYLQQLIMESLGNERDLAGKIVNQGITVYGNKGTTDQHAYVQQLRDGVKNFFVTFIEVLSDREGRSLEVDPGITSGNYLNSFLQGTRNALFENGRESLTITIEKLDARTVGALIALFERAVGFYATLVNINAYYQPGFKAVKKWLVQLSIFSDRSSDIWRKIVADHSRLKSLQKRSVQRKEPNRHSRSLNMLRQTGTIGSRRQPIQKSICLNTE